MSGIAPLIEDDAVIGDCGEGEGRDEARGIRREDDADVRPRIPQPADELGRLVRRDATTHPKNDSHITGMRHE